MATQKRVWLFADGNASMRDLLGGKGANLAEMSNIGLPVPPGFTITTEVCNDYYAEGGFPDGLMDEIKAALADVEKDQGKKLGDPTNPLLLSVRSGARFSMPGMMDTVLNLGLNDVTVASLIASTGNARFVYDSYRRFIMMLSDVAYSNESNGLSKHDFEHIFYAMKTEKGVENDLDIDGDGLKELCDKYKAYVKEKTGNDFPQDVFVQLKDAVEAVFRSWNNERAFIYRRREHIPDEIGTAVNVQAMVFGNMGEDCGTGVAFTRNASGGTKEVFGEYLMNAQGEDVVAGVRTPMPISELEKNRTRRSTPSSTRSATRSKITTMTCRTSSSRSSTTNCSSCSAARASEPARPPSRSRSTSWARAASPRKSLLAASPRIF